jgi:lysozyme
MINKASTDLIKSFEGCSLKAYKCPAGIWTIGYGTTAAAGVGVIPHEGMKITQAQADHYLEITIEKFSTEVATLLTRATTQNEFGAFVSLAYNIGVGAFKKSSALRYFNAGEHAKAADAILMWNKAGGKVLAGLTRRRMAERDLFLTESLVIATRIETRETVAAPDALRENPAESSTMQAGTIQIVSAAGAGVSAVSALTGTAQIVAMVFCGVVVLAALWIMRERLRKWAEGDR